MEFELTARQRAIQEMARDFRQRFVDTLDRAAEYTVTDARQRYPWHIVREGSRVGLRTLAVPEADGGGGADPVALCLAGEELARGDLGIAVLFSQTWLYSRLLAEALDAGQRARFYEPFLRDPEHVLAGGITEDLYGSDNLIPYHHPECGLRASAVREGDTWRINARKQFVTHGAEARVMFVYCRTDPTRGLLEGTTCILVPLDAPGVSVETIHDKIGQRFVNNAAVVFRDVRVPTANTVGEVDRASATIGFITRESHAYVEGAAAVGLARAALEAATEHVRTRVQGGRPLLEQQAVGVELAEMKIQIEAARSMIHRAGWLARYDKDADPTITTMCKVFATDMAVRVTQKAMELFGGYGIMRGHPVEKYHRDALTLLSSGGPALANRIKVWNRIRGVTFSTP
jgi:alkylation response protein AidB-like acyl-CoA dehydrogenase